MIKQNIVFIVNPKAGITPKSKFFVKLLAGKLLNSEQFVPEVIFTQYPGHATLLAKEAVENGAEVVVAMGGDGTVNEVAQSLCGTDVALGILPGGSGNGLARELGLPMDIFRALKIIGKNKSRKIDVVQVNDRIFVSIAGIGFDAHVAQEFSQSGFRGLISYMKIILKQLRSYKPLNYSLKTNGTEITREALMISFANGKQFGFHARIAPHASIDDGYIDVCIIRHMSFISAFLVAPRLFNGSVAKSKYYESFRAQEIKLPGTAGSYLNIDGEPVRFDTEIQMTVMPGSLKVLVP